VLNRKQVRDGGARSCCAASAERNITLQLVDIHKSYARASVTVFSGLNLSVAAGEFIVVLGRSGSGKSTLLNLIAGIDRPDRGRVLLGGTDLGALGEPGITLYRRRHIGIVFQGYNLLPTLTVRENVTLPLALNGTAPDTRVDDLLDRLGLRERQERFPEELSGGEQQRAAIARALVHGPAIVLADEPTGNLDAQTGREVVGLLDELVRKAGTTLIMATHSAEMMGYADRELHIRDGRITPE
jgi:putative ABC transport system ATP-binding protein